MSKHILVIGVARAKSQSRSKCVSWWPRLVRFYVQRFICAGVNILICFFFGNLLFIGIDWLYMIESILILLNFNLSLNHYQGGGSNDPNQIIMIKSLQMIVRLTSNLSLPVV